MTWQLTLASCAAANLKPGLPPDPLPTDPVSVEWDVLRKPSAYTLSNLNRDVENTGANDLQACQIAAKAIRPGEGPVYFEISVQSLGAATGAHSLGIIGDMASRINESRPSHDKNTGTVIMADNTIYTRNVQVHSGVAAIGAGAVVGVAVDAGAGKCWIWVNNVLQGAGADWATGVPTSYIAPGYAYYPAVACRDNGDKFRLHSIASEFNYSAPAGALPLGNDNLNFDYYYLINENNAFMKANNNSTGYSLSGWTVDPAGSGVTSMSLTTGSEPFTPRIHTLAADLFTGYSYNASAPQYTTVPTTAGKTWASLYQDHALEARFNDLIDAGGYALRMSAQTLIRNQPLSVANASFVASFFDETDTLISEEDSGLLATLAYQRHERYIDVPPGTRKIRTAYLHHKASSANSTGATEGGACIVHNRQAALMRKMPLLAASKGGGNAMVLLAPPNDKIAVNKARSFIILTP